MPDARLSQLRVACRGKILSNRKRWSARSVGRSPPTPQRRRRMRQPCSPTMPKEAAGDDIREQPLSAGGRAGGPCAADGSEGP
ncbi:Hypothetical Protein RSKD131_3680 [Cereibacter sphaeroides KD131]|nr:Hypothetical Protein RSKD131_3680 [Cereibacter sphaeroides KD131]